MAASWIVGSVSVRAGRLGPIGTRLAGKKVSRPGPGAPSSHDVRIVTEDGLGLAASYWPGCHARAPAILILHGMGAFRAGYAANAAWFAAQGYAALTVDLRGHGDSDAALCGLGLPEAADAWAAFSWLKGRQNGAPVLVIGISMGGAAALLGDAGPLPADALILQAVYSDLRHTVRHRIGWAATALPGRILEPLLSWQSWPRLGVAPSRLAPIRAVRSYRGPVLVIGGAADAFTPPHETRALYAAVPGPKDLWIVPEVAHYDVSHLETPSYRARVLDFLQATCGPARRERC